MDPEGMPVLPSSSGGPSLLLVGDWQVDARANELRRPGRTLRLEPKAMQVLLRLAAAAGTVVTRSELLDDVWPDAVVGDEALTQAVIKLRRAFGDNPREPTCIETISKRGYRLIAPVDTCSRVPGPDPAPIGRAESLRAVRRWSAVGVLLLLLLTGAAWFVAQAPAPSRPGVIDDVPTIAVTPFESIGAGDDAYLARGIGNDLATDLVRLAGMRVLREPSPVDAGDHARFVVTGGVQRDGDMLRITVHLTDPVTRQLLWSGRFQRPFDDLFAVQDEIVRGLVDLLPGKLRDAAKQQAARRYTRNLQAYDHFLRGQAQFLRRQPADNEAARASYRAAIELDPTFARAYSGLAMTYAIEARLQPQSDPGPRLERALQLAETAREIDPSIPEVHWAVAFVLVQQCRHEAALKALERTVALDPAYADAYALMAGIRTYVGEPARSVPLLRTALRLGAGGGYLYFTLLGRAYLFMGDAEQAVINLQAAAARNPVDLETRIFLAAALAQAGDVAAAAWEAEEVLTLAPGFSASGWLRTYPLTAAAQQRRLQELLASAGL
jgi:DNA-binding winged helix-turn-helix (wHTH) protein/TolB-like protein